MATTCRSCGAALSEGAGRCPSCLALVTPPGFFQRMFSGVKVNLQTSTASPSAPKTGIHISFNTSLKHTYKILDPKTGQMKEYHSLDEVPAEMRTLIEQARKTSPPPQEPR